MDFASAAVREQSKQFSKWCRTGQCDQLDNSNREWQFRAMGVGEAAKGAKTVPDAFYTGLVAGMNQTNPLRRYATRLVTETGAPIRVPVYDDSSVEAVILPENAQSASADVDVDAIELDAYKLHSKIVKVSSELLEDGGMAVHKHIGTMLGRRTGRLASQLFTTGSGSDEPTGILTVATVAVTTVAPTALTYGDLVDLRFSLDASYEEASQWLMAPSTLKAICKLTDDNSRPVFQGGELLGKPVILSAAMPVMAAETKPILFGDLRSYCIRETSETAVRRYDETFAEAAQIGLAAIHRVDGNLADVNGVAVLQMAEA
jgi:HK97 family phage major capsid protein